MCRSHTQKNASDYGENLIDNVNSIMKFGLTLNVKKCWSPLPCVVLHIATKPHRERFDAIRIRVILISLALSMCVCDFSSDWKRGEQEEMKKKMHEHGKHE